MIRLKESVIFTDAQCEELFNKCGDDPNIISSKSPGLILITDITDDWNISVSINQEEGFVRVDGECSTRCNLSDSCLVRALCDVSEDFKDLSKIVKGYASEDMLKSAVIPYIFVPLSKISLVGVLQSELLFRAKIIESEYKDDEKAMRQLLSYTGRGDSFFIIKPNDTKIKVLPAKDVDDKKLVKKICNEIDSFTSAIQIPAKESPLYIQNEIHKHGLFHKDLETDNDLNYIVNENEELRREIKKLQLENNRLNACMPSKDKKPLLYYGEESDFYEGEIKDFILELIKDQMKTGGVTHDKKRFRRYDVLKDVFDANGYTGSHQEKRETLKTALTGYRTMTLSTKMTLEELGFTVEHYKHCKIRYYNDPRYESVLPCSGSDGRLGNNAYTAIKNTCF